MTCTLTVHASFDVSSDELIDNLPTIQSSCSVVQDFQVRRSNGKASFSYALLVYEPLVDIIVGYIALGLIMF